MRTRRTRSEAADLVLANSVRDGDCIRHTGSRDSKGYGMVFADGRNQLAHRVVYLEVVGPIPEGLELDHLCRVRDCVNIDHLEAVTHRVNLLRSDNLAAVHARKTHCLVGHEFTPENTCIVPGGRSCRQCKRRRQSEYKARRRIRERGLDPANDGSR